MLRMEIALFLVTAFVAYVYFAAEKEPSSLHRTFSLLLVMVLANLALDGATVYTVNHLSAVPELLNSILHRLFLGSMVAVIFLFYQYIALLVEEETGKPRRLDGPALAFLALAELCNFLLPLTYTQTPEGNYSSAELYPAAHCGKRSAPRPEEYRLPGRHYHLRREDGEQRSGDLRPGYGQRLCSGEEGRHRRPAPGLCPAAGQAHRQQHRHRQRAKAHQTLVRPGLRPVLHGK